MKLFAIAFGIVCGVAAVLFGVAFALLWLFQYPQPHAAAGALAGVVILAFPKCLSGEKLNPMNHL